MKDKIDLQKLTADLKEKYPDAGITSVDVDTNSGKATFLLSPNKKNLAVLEKPGMAIQQRVHQAHGSTITRDALTRQSLHLMSPTSPYEMDAKSLFKKADEYYYTDPLLGSVVNTLSSMSMKGFELDIDDKNIKSFYETWCFDVNFAQVLEWIFLDFFKIGHVTTYKVLAKYEPRVSYLSPAPGQKIKADHDGSELDRINKLHAKYEEDRINEIAGLLTKAKETGATQTELKNIELAAKKNIWSKGHLPVAFTVLNPQLVTIDGNLLFDNVAVKLTPPPELGQLLKKDKSLLTEDEKELIKALPTDLKAAAEKGGEFQLDSRLVGMVCYRKQPYERYAKPRSTRIFDTLEYKRALRDADLSTLDGISNFILKVSIGNDNFPVTSQEELETVAKLFSGNSRAFDVIWNHTLNIEKIVSPEIGEILGQSKYLQVNDDITAGLAVTRALIDGGGDTNQAEVDLLTKGLTEEINYARRQVERWIYGEFAIIAEAMGFDRFPKVRWDDSVLKDQILYLTTLASLVDRRMLSYNTALELLGFSYDNELKNMQVELPLVEDGVFGIIGSPFQKAAAPGGVQPTQKAPTGTPSNGRPAGQKKKKTTNTNPTKQPGAKPTKPKKTASVEEIKEMSNIEYSAFLGGAYKILDAEEFAEFMNEMNELRYNDGN